MPSTDWHILRVETGRELHVHELLTHKDVGAEVWTPFETRFQSKRGRNNRGQSERKPYAVPVFRGYVIFRVSDNSVAQAILSHIESRSYMYGVMTKGERLVVLGDDMRCALAEYLSSSESGRFVTGRSFDPKRDARKNQQRVYAPSQTVPVLKEGELVTFTSGPFEGLSGHAYPVSDNEVRIKSDDLGVLSGMVVSPFALRKAG